MDTKTYERDQVQNLINYKLAELFYGITEIPTPQRPANLELVPYYQPQPTTITYAPVQTAPPIAVDYYQSEAYQQQQAGSRLQTNRTQARANFYATLEQHAYAQIVEPAAYLKHPLETIGHAPLFEERRLYHGPNSLWIIMPLENDPLLAAGEEFRIPKYQLKVIKRLHKGGVNPDRLYIAHELPLGSVNHPGQVTAAMIRPKAPPQALAMARRLGLAGAITLQAAAAPVAMAGIVGGLGLKAAQTIIANPIILDPILFGVVVHPQRLPHAGEMGSWFELLRWQA